jgi:hypothetical protein
VSTWYSKLGLTLPPQTHSPVAANTSREPVWSTLGAAYATSVSLLLTLDSNSSVPISIQRVKSRSHTSIQASISADSHLRIYECPAPSSGTALSSWTLLESIDVSSLPLTPSLTSQYAPSSSSGFSFPGSPSNQRTTEPSSAGGLTPPVGYPQSNSRQSIESEGGWALSWCKEAWWGELVAVSSGAQGAVRVRG